MQRVLLALVLLLAGCAPAAQLRQEASSTPAMLAQLTPSAPVIGAITPSIEPTTLPRPTPGGTPTPAPAALPPAAYSLDRDGVVWSRAPGTSNAAEVTRLPTGASGASLSPDGATLAFIVGAQLFVRILSDGADREITPAGVSALAPLSGFRWAPDSTALLFDLDGSADPLEGVRPTIYLSALRPAAEIGPAQPLATGLGPSWAPDSSRIAYAGPPFDSFGTPWGGGPGGVLTVADRTGRVERTLAGASSISPDGVIYPAWQPILWSADGARLAAGTSVFDLRSGTPVLEAPTKDAPVLAAIQWLGATGESAGFWQAVRQGFPGGDDPGRFTEHDEYLLLSSGAPARLLVRGPALECPCLPLVPEPEVAWGHDGLLLAAGPLDGAETTGPRLYSPDGALLHTFALPAGQSLMLPPLWAPGRGYLLVTLWDGAAPTSWILPLSGGEPQLAAPGSALAWGM